MMIATFEVLIMADARSPSGSLKMGPADGGELRQAAGAAAAGWLKDGGDQGI